MTIQQRIDGKIRSVFAPQVCELINESRNHGVPPGSETHFKLLVVSKTFEGKTLVDRHRLIYGLLEPEMKGGVHALALQAYTPDEWLAYQTNRKSPPCLGGSKNG
ncbi:BolA family transcriptional regulator [bacterium]|nr:BolA family transcriptional regulator [bacterium]